MKILCQEHYDKVVQYAKEIGDISLDNCPEKAGTVGKQSQLPV